MEVKGRRFEARELCIPPKPVPALVDVPKPPDVPCVVLPKPDKQKSQLERSRENMEGLDLPPVVPLFDPNVLLPKPLPPVLELKLNPLVPPKPAMSTLLFYKNGEEDCKKEIEEEDYAGSRDGRNTIGRI